MVRWGARFEHDVAGIGYRTRHQIGESVILRPPSGTGHTDAVEHELRSPPSPPPPGKGAGRRGGDDAEPQAAGGGARIEQPSEHVLEIDDNEFRVAVVPAGVAALVADGHEVLVGMTEDPTFGPLVVFGLGGVAHFRRAGTTVHPLRPEQSTALVTGGVYRLSRNPMYLGMVLVLLGCAVTVGASTALLVPPLLFGSVYLGIMAASFQPITPNQMRGLTTAYYLFLTNIMGLAVGTSVMAAFTDFIFRDDAMLHYSIASANALFYPLAIILFAYGLKGYRASMAEAGNWQID